MPPTSQEAWSQITKLQAAIQSAAQAFGNTGQATHLKTIVEQQQGIIAILIGLLRSPGSDSTTTEHMRLQRELQNMTQLTTMISNVMKSRHDTAKNIIANMR